MAITKIKFPRIAMDTYLSSVAGNALELKDGKLYASSFSIDEYLSETDYHIAKDASGKLYVYGLADELADIYSKREVDDLIAAINQFDYVAVDSLPATPSADTMYKIYLVPNSGSGTNVKDEYITLRSGEEGSYTYTWEKLGTTEISLDNYYTKDEVDGLLDDKQDQVVAGDGVDLAADKKTLSINMTQLQAHFVDSEVLVDSADGSTTAYTLANTPIDGSVKVYVDGLRMVAGASNDYTISGGTITFTQAPETTSRVTADYMKA